MVDDARQRVPLLPVEVQNDLPHPASLEANGGGKLAGLLAKCNPDGGLTHLWGVFRRGPLEE